LSANLSTEDALNEHLLRGLEPAGVPQGLTGTALPFRYNRIDEVEAIISIHRDDLAAIVMEPIRDCDPQPGFLERIRELATKSGGILIFDEVTSGWRLNTGGVHLLYGVIPDITVFAKAMSNGYPMAAIIGRRDVMQAAERSFISSTYWTEKIGPVAALATIRKHQRFDVWKHLIEVGNLIRSGWQYAADRYGLQINVTGIPPLARFSWNYENDQAILTLFTQMMLERGFLATGAFYATFAHQHCHVESYLSAVDEVFGLIARAIEKKEVEKLLKGPVAHAGFYRLT